MKSFSVLIEAPAKDWEERVQNLAAFPGFQGILELPDENSMTFTPSKDFEVLEFGSEAAKKCMEWMENDFDRRSEFRFLRLYFESEFLPNLADLSAQVKELDSQSRIISVKEEEQIDYQAEFKKSFRGADVGKSFWVGPQWDQPSAGRKPIWIEPGMAFGTGDHPTTQLCIAYLEELAAPPKTIFDLGTGTGVLAVVARKLFPGADIWASDLDPQCAEDFQKTLALNGMSPSQFHGYFGAAGDLRRLQRILPPLELLVSNIYSEVLSDLLPNIKQVLLPGATWLVSGILNGPQSQEFIRKAQDSGFKLLAQDSRKKQRSHFEKKSGLTLEEETWLGLKFIRGE